MNNALKIGVAAVAISLSANAAVANTPSAAVAASVTQAVPPAKAEKKQVFALVSAVGDKFTYVRQRQSVGSNILDNNTRQSLTVPGNALNMAVLRGLDSAMEKAHPDSERIYIALSASEMDGVLPQDREAVAIGKIVSELEKRPERASWDKIIVATPKYLQSERAGMGPKLHGLGVYVQPLAGASIEGLGDELEIDVSQQGESDTTNPEDGKKNKSKLYVAPYSYIQVYVIDPKTMRVIEKNARHDFQKLNDPNSTALDVGRSIPIGMLAKSVGALIERSAARAVGGTEIGVSVQIEEVRPGAPAKGAPTTK